MVKVSNKTTMYKGRIEIHSNTIIGSNKDVYGATIYIHIKGKRYNISYTALTDKLTKIDMMHYQNQLLSVWNSKSLDDKILHVDFFVNTKASILMKQESNYVLTKWEVERLKLIELDDYWNGHYASRGKNVEPLWRTLNKKNELSEIVKTA